MFIPFFLELKAEKIPVTLRELLALHEGLREGIAAFDVEAFYFLARAALVKDERFIDRFDQAFQRCFSGLDALSAATQSIEAEIPEDWLRKLAEKHLSDDDKALIESLGGFDTLMETLRQRLSEQTGRHQGGSKWIGTAGTSPFGAHGYNPEGVRIGQQASRHQRAVKVWDRREFRNYDDTVELGTRNIKVALKRLRHWVRQGADDELDLAGTIRSTAEHGYLDVVTRPECRNAVKLLMFFDAGGSMDGHIKVMEELFSAARAEFRRMDYFYFHNCIYEGVWKDNRRRRIDVMPTLELLRTYGRDYRVIFVGDASMSPYEISHPGGSVEHWNSEAGQVWLHRMTAHFSRCVWLNPIKPEFWNYSPSNVLIRQIFPDRMYPLTLGGLQAATQALSR